MSPSSLPSLDEASKLAFTFAKEIATTLITLSTGLLTLSVTYAKEILKGVPKSKEGTMKSAWGLHILSMFFGVVALMALTGALMPLDPSKRSLEFDKTIQGFCWSADHRVLSGNDFTNAGI